MQMMQCSYTLIKVIIDILENIAKYLIARNHLSHSHVSSTAYNFQEFSRLRTYRPLNGILPKPFDLLSD